MTDTQERFLRDILTRVALDDVVELHLFPAIRRGTLETGVAVLAMVPPPPAPVLVVDGEALDEEDVGAEDAPVAVADAAVEAGAEVEAAADSDAQIDARDDAVGDVDAAPEGEPEPTPSSEVVGDVSAELDAPPDADLEADGGEPIEALAPADVARVVTSPRTLILTASYRHTIKGPDRGKWLVDVQAEADAPLDAVEAVLRGVRHRSSEPADPERVAHETLAALVAPTIVAPAA